MARHTYFAITTINPNSGWRIVAGGHKRKTVENAAHSINGNATDIFTDTKRKNMRVVSKTSLKRYYGIDWNAPEMPPLANDYAWVG